MMELNRIKELLKHEEYVVRDMASKYLEKGGFTAPDITELILDMYESAENEYESNHFLYTATVFKHNEDTLRRLRLLAGDSLNDHLRNIFIRTDITILDAFVSQTEIPEESMEIYNARKCFSSTPTPELWDELWEYSESGLELSFKAFDYGHGELIVSELSKRDDFPYDKFLEKISIDYGEDYEGWDDAYLCYMAGELKSEDSIEFLLDTMEIDGDLICEKASEALGKIGTPAVIRSIKERYPYCPEHFKIYVNGVFERIKSDECEAAVLKLMVKERDASTKTMFADTLTRMFSKKGMPVCIEMLDIGYDEFLTSLEEGVYVTHIAHNLQHPDMDAWKKKVDENYKKNFEIKSKISDNEFKLNQETVSEVLDRLNEQKKAQAALQRKYDKKLKVGRNDPCPCGSGQKYKRCCGSGKESH